MAAAVDISPTVLNECQVPNHLSSDTHLCSDFQNTDHHVLLPENHICSNTQNLANIATLAVDISEDILGSNPLVKNCAGHRPIPAASNICVSDTLILTDAGTKSDTLNTGVVENIVRQVLTAVDHKISYSEDGRSQVNISVEDIEKGFFNRATYKN